MITSESKNSQIESGQSETPTNGRQATVGRRFMSACQQSAAIRSVIQTGDGHPPSED